MTPYRIADRLGEPTSWIGVLVAIIGYAIPLLIPPTAWSHIAGCVQTLLGTALFFLPDNRMIATAEDIALAIAGVLPARYAAPLMPSPAAAQFGVATITPQAPAPKPDSQAGFALRELLGLLCGLAVLAILIMAVSGCSTKAAQQAAQDIQIVAPAVQTISSDLACQIQAGANAGTAAFTAAGDGKNAQITNATSIAAGYLCTGKPVGTPLGTPLSQPASAAQ